MTREMRTVYLHGALKQFQYLHSKDSAPFRLCVKSSAEAVQLLAVQIPEFAEMIGAGSFKIRLGADGKIHRTMRAGEERVTLGKKNEIHIVPVSEAAWTGENRSMGKVILGVALLGAGLGGGAIAGAGLAAEIGVGGVTFGNIALTGASLAFTGLAQVLAPNPSVGRYEQREAPEDRPNFLFNGPVNSINVGAAIPWVYGRDVLCSSVVISASIVDEQIGPGIPEPATDGMVATVQASAAGEIVKP